jgi:RHS repeat-associated protein
VSWNGVTYEYDRLNMLTKMVNGTQTCHYVYTADDERFWGTSCGTVLTVRDLDGKVLRDGFATATEYVYRGGQLLGKVEPSGAVRHFHLDHLGTARLVTGTGSGAGSGFYTLFPCRVLDTRNTTPLATGEARSMPMAGACGIPGTASAVSVNLTALQAPTLGEIAAYPAGLSNPGTSALSYRVSNARANMAILKLGGGGLTFFNNQPSGGGVHLIVDVNGYFVEGGVTVVARHTYLPYGEEATATTQDGERLKFTAHERDLLGTVSSPADDLDYMHARHYSPITGRFLSFDPFGGNPQWPQSWNRYSHVLGNPLKYIDPYGLLPECGVPHCTVVGQAPYDSTDFTGFNNFLRFGSWLSGGGPGSLNALPRDLGRNSFSLYFNASASTTRQLGQSFTAFADGLFPGEPFAASGLYESEEYGIAHFTGELTPALAAAAATYGGALGTPLSGSALARAQVSDFVRVGSTVVSNQLVTGPGAKGAVLTWAIKGGGVNPRTGFRLPFHYHIHRGTDLGSGLGRHRSSSERDWNDLREVDRERNQGPECFGGGLCDNGNLERWSRHQRSRAR